MKIKTVYLLAPLMLALVCFNTYTFIYKYNSSELTQILENEESEESDSQNANSAPIINEPCFFVQLKNFNISQKTYNHFSEGKATSISEKPKTPPPNFF